MTHRVKEERFTSPVTTDVESIYSISCHGPYDSVEFSNSHSRIREEVTRPTEFPLRYPLMKKDTG